MNKMSNTIANYLKNNKNVRNVVGPYSEEDLIESKVEFEKEKATFVQDTNCEQPYAIIIDGKQFNLEYEEMFEILNAINDCSLGNECFIPAKLKSNYIKSFLPVTDY